MTKASLLYIHIADLTFQIRKIMGVHSGNTESSSIILATDAQKSTHHVGLLLINIFSNPFAVNASEILYFRSLFLAFIDELRRIFVRKGNMNVITDAGTFFLIETVSKNNLSCATIRNRCVWKYTPLNYSK